MIDRDELHAVARACGLPEQLVDGLTPIVDEALEVLSAHDEPPVVNVAAERDPGRRPRPDEDPCNAIVRWCRVVAHDREGPLSGVRLGLKDTIAIAGVPLTAGSDVLRDYVPVADSVVTRRLLEAGAEIVAVTNMDAFGFSAGGDTSVYGPVSCPFDRTRSAGGSSGGSGAALHLEGIDATLGCDQGGSIRLPAAWCGAVGLKPTFGLVPYTGILGIDRTVDHVGPLAATVERVGDVLQAIAGPDPSDPRQPQAPPRDVRRAIAAAPDDLRGVRIGVLAEAVDDAEPLVAEAFAEAMERFALIGARVERVSIPEHRWAGSINLVACIASMAAFMSGQDDAFNGVGRAQPELGRALVEGLRRSADTLSVQLQLARVHGEALRRCHGGALRAKAWNLRPTVRAAYDRALADVDLLAMPTAPFLPHRHDPTLDPETRVRRGWDVLANTTTADVTGHPAVSLPAAEVASLPVGVMLVAPAFADDRLLAWAHTFERMHGWAQASVSQSVTYMKRNSIFSRVDR